MEVILLIIFISIVGLSLGSWLVIPRKTEHRTEPRKRTLSVGDQNTLCALKEDTLGNTGLTQLGP